ncbi:ribulose-phosphate 3-epimerase [Candidatus Woesearchaeota archaeon]|nr:ribulose-phosphate 3-epimerase [Candidatus Woesearchaeota archaeon]
MSRRILISPSLLAAGHDTPEAVRAAVAVAERGGADLLHVDVMDGEFVPETTLWNDPGQVKRIKTVLPLDVHIMINNPDDRYMEFVRAGANMLAFHVEAAKDPEALLSRLQRHDVKVGISLNPETPLDKILPYLPLVDYVLIMSVRPGKAGQQFIPGVVEKIVFIKYHFPHVLVQVDGGMNPVTAAFVINAGADIIVAGAAVYGSRNPAKAIANLRRAADHDV